MLEICEGCAKGASVWSIEEVSQGSMARPRSLRKCSIFVTLHPNLAIFSSVISASLLILCIWFSSKLKFDSMLKHLVVKAFVSTITFWSISACITACLEGSLVSNLSVPKGLYRQNTNKSYIKELFMYFSSVDMLL